ncbi:MAG: class I SAM-dependent methyltransferase [Halobacteriota archaeon]
MDEKDFEGIIEVLHGHKSSESTFLIELGAGVSTLVLANLLPRLCHDVHIISIEGDESYARQLRDRIKTYELDRIVSLHHVPYANSDDGCWFNKDSLRRVLDDKKVDILLVDAPPGGLCRNARQPAIPFFLSYLTQNGVVLLHDTHREDESAIADGWSHYFNVQYRIETPRGFDVFERR